jgi:(S)-2-hydroxy-acid oxidase
MHTILANMQVSMPIGIAPTALQRMAHPDGECASAKGEKKKKEKIIRS